MSQHYYDRQGRSITIAEWGQLLHDTDYKFIGFDADSRYRVSTVWIGEDRSSGRCGGPALIFETTVYEGGGEMEREVALYSTMQSALEGHRQLATRYISVIDSLAELGRAIARGVTPTLLGEKTAGQRATESGHWRRRRAPRPR